MCKAIYSAALMLAAFSFSLSAQSVDAVVARVLANDPAMAAERSRLHQLEDEIHASNTLRGPELGMSYKWGLDGVGNKWDVEFAQEFDWPGLYRARSRRASLQAGAFATLYRAKEVEQALLVRNAVYALLAARADVEILSHWEENLRELAAAYDRLLTRGETTILEVRKLKLEIFLARTQISGAHCRLSAAEADLQALNGGNMPEGLPEDMAMESLKPYEWYKEQLIACDPEIAASRRLCELARQDARVASMGGAPGFKLGYLYENEAGEQFHGFSFAITLPAWNNRAASRAANAKIIETMAQGDVVLLDRQARVYAEFSSASRFLEQINAGAELFGPDSDYLSILRKALDGGKLNLLEFIREENEFLQAALEYNALCYQYNCAASSLNRADFCAND